jgi:hypothetical protein
VPYDAVFTKSWLAAAISTATANWIRPCAAWHLAGHEGGEPTTTRVQMINSQP